MAINLITLETPSATEAPLQDKLNGALVRELLHRTKGAGVALLGAVVLLWLIIGANSGTAVFAQFLVLVGLILIRLVGAAWLARRDRFDHMRVFRWFAAVNFLIGGGLGAIVMTSYPHLPPLGVAMCSVCIVGINSAAMVSLASSPLIYLLYVCSNMAALTFVSFAHPLLGLEHSFQVMQLIYSMALIVMMRNVHRSLRNNIVLRLQLGAINEELGTRNTEMRMVLDHVDQGLVIAGTDGRLSAARSAVLDTWFPEGVPETLAGFFADDPGTAAWFDLTWEQLVEGVLGLDEALFQLPKQLRRGDRALAFNWQPIVNQAGGIERMLVVLSDVTEALRLAAAEREQKQLMAIFDALSEDRSGVIEFLKEATATVAEIAAGTASAEVEKRLVHTLKGNSALFGLSALAARCHEIEDAMEVDARRMTDGERRCLGAAWQAVHHKLAHFIDVGEGVLQVRKADFERALSALRREGSLVAREIEMWSLEPLEVRFRRIGEQARALAERLGKQPMQVQIDHGELYIDSETWAAFWAAFVHVVRNAIDHGLEDAEERAQLGKGTATLTLRSYLRGGALVFEFSDDGRGIAWDKLRDKARAAGLATETQSDLVAALFHDGISTRAVASEMSGRGVGLGALVEVCRAMACQITVDSSPGEGTTMRFEFSAAHSTARRARPVSREQLAFPPLSP